VFFIITEHLSFTNQFASDALKYDIPGHIKIITGQLAIIPEQPEWFPIGVSPVMGFSAGIGRVAVLVTDMFDLLEV
jgi:uncharacterized radical SAM superfamily Fe-S cluster-containing enzyme